MSWTLAAVVTPPLSFESSSSTTYSCGHVALADGSAGAILNHMVHNSDRLDSAFSALSDRTRRGVLERLGRGNASITTLAAAFEMTLTGMRKHVRILEEAGLVETSKVGRVRECSLGARTLSKEASWIAKYRQSVEERFDHLEAFLEQTKESEP